MDEGSGPRRFKARNEHEVELRKYLHQHSSQPNSLNVLSVKEKIIDSDNVLFYWSMVEPIGTRPFFWASLLTVT